MGGSGKKDKKSKKSKKEEKKRKREDDVVSLFQQTVAAAPVADLSFLLGSKDNANDLASLFDSEKAKVVPSTVASVSGKRRSGDDPEQDLSEQSDEAQQEAFEAKLKKKKVKPVIDPEEEREKSERTVFVGGIPVSVIKTDKLLKYFAKFGTVESVRFRSIAMNKLSNPQMRRVGFIKGEFNEKQETCNAYVVFVDKNSVPLALAENGREDFQEGFPLRVDTVEPTISHKKSIFVGNLPFAAQERELRAAFADFGAIEYVRIVRDKATSLGRGYAYVCFVKREGAKLAAEKKDVEIGGRVVRIERCKKPGDKTEDSKVKKARTAPSRPKKPGPPPPRKQGPKMPQRQKKKLNQAMKKKK